MFGGFMFPFFAALYFWYPKIIGRRMNETLGKLQFWMLTIGFTVMSLGQMRVGLLGMRRRIAHFDPSMPGFISTHLIVTIAGFVVAASMIVLFINMWRSAKKGEVATGNLWESRSPEWQIPSPTPIHNYDQDIIVVGEPYDYGLDDEGYIKLGQAAPSAYPAD